MTYLQGLRSAAEVKTVPGDTEIALQSIVS